MRGKKWDLSDGTKPCAKCGATKPIEAFGRNRYSFTGLAAYCKNCVAQAARDRRATPEGQRAHRESNEKWVANLPGIKVSEGSKLCPKCHIEKPFGQYPKNRRSKQGIGTYCSLCSVEMVKARRATPDGAQAHRDASKRWRDANVARHADNGARWRYGVEHGGYETMLSAQDGKCAICTTTEPGAGLRRFHIDHCHNSNTVRGLLCDLCNRGLGHFKDDPQLLTAAINYLAKSATET